MAEILIKWTCGCSIVRDGDGRLYEQPGLLCPHLTPHRDKVERSTPEGEHYRERGLFDVDNEATGW